jgi:hypothetical protein
LDEYLFRILLISLGFHRERSPRLDVGVPIQTTRDIMKKLGYIIAALGTIAIAAPSIASAEEMMIRHDHDRMNARAEMHRDHGWHHHHHHDRMMMRHHDHR